MLTAAFLGRLALAIIFASAAAAELRGITVSVRRGGASALSAQPILVATVVCIECGLALVCLLSPGNGALFFAVGGFMVGASCFISYGLAARNETECNCWTAHFASEDNPRSPVLRLYDRPTASAAAVPKQVWYGARNGGITLVAWLIGGMPGQGLLPERAYRGLLTAGLFAVCPAIILGGVLLSVLLNKHWLTVTEHPRKKAFAASLAPLVALSWYAGDGNFSDWL